jgi:diguanylate cyclase (GGDEF)-like protein/PAS domain S-box-containing protein
MRYAKTTGRILLIILLTSAIYLTSLYSYLLFHSITEVFSVIVMGSIFALAWNTRHWMEDDYFLFIGIAFLFVALIDFLHTLAYKGMNIFPGYDANLPTQLWILARYIQSISLLVAPIWLRKRLSPGATIAIYLVGSSVLVGLIFVGKFPTCYVEGVGLTTFKIVSEYIIILILTCSLIPLAMNRNKFEGKIFQALVVFIFLTIGAELAFTDYLGVYDAANLIGHLLKLVSFYILYRALLRTGLQQPFDLVFRDLKQKETALLRSEANLQRLFDISPFPVIISKLSDSHLIKVNHAALETFELTAEDLPNYTGLDFYVNSEERSKMLQKVRETGEVHNEPMEFRTKSGKPIWCLVDATSIDFEGEACILIGMADITEQRRIQEELQYLSMHDALTGVYNRTYFEAELNRLRKGRQYPVSIIMLDTDNLKVVNDTYGHVQGDKMLQKVAGLVGEVLRAEEVFARIGGDEFAILLPRSNADASRLVVARIEHQLEHRNSRDGNERLEVSIGLGTADMKDDLIEAFKRADADMYANKNIKKRNTKSRGEN